MMLICSIIFFFSFPLYNASKNKTELLHVIDPTLDPKESCVICKYAFQKLSNLFKQYGKLSSLKMIKKKNFHAYNNDYDKQVRAD